MSFFNLNGAGAITYFFWVLLIGAFVVEAWAFVDAIRRPAASFVAAGKQTKLFWIMVLVLGAFVPIIGIIAGIVYFVDVRPARHACLASASPRSAWMLRS